MNALVVSTGGQHWGAGLDRAAQLLFGQRGTLTLVHIIPRTASYGRGLPVWDEWDDLQAESAASAALLREGARHLAACCPALTISTRSVAGEPPDVVLRLVAELGADVLILDGRLQEPCALATASEVAPQQTDSAPALARQPAVAAGA
jgi:nucleotide-binding universal stress UspA family protein